MALTPTLPAGAVTIGELQKTAAVRQPSKTWRIDWDTGRIQGKTDGKEALRQAVQLALQTERFAYLIYSRNYGAELRGMLGESGRTAEAELRRLVREALIQDDRIEDVTDFSAGSAGKRGLTLSFTVQTEAGAVPIETEVEL